MAEEVSSPSVSKVDADAEEEQSRLMAMRKAMAKVHLRTALDNELQKVDEGLFISKSPLPSSPADHRLHGEALGWNISCRT